MTLSSFGDGWKLVPKENMGKLSFRLRRSEKPVVAWCQRLMGIKH